MTLADTCPNCGRNVTDASTTAEVKLFERSIDERIYCECGTKVGGFWRRIN